MWTEITRPKHERTGQRYASDLSDREWAVIAPLMPAPKRLGRPRETDLRAVLDAILYIARSGCQWLRALLNGREWKGAAQLETMRLSGNEDGCCLESGGKCRDGCLQRVEVNGSGGEVDDHVGWSGRQRGYEDLIDHDQLRHDPVLATLAGKLAARRPRCAPLAGKSTLNRLEHGTEGYTRYHKIGHDGDAVAMLFVELFLDAHRRPPKQITLDLDATDDPLHGHQEGRFFHGDYDCYCYLPLYVFCGRHLLAAKLRRSNIDASAGALDAVARIVAHIRRRWPKVRILLRADQGLRPRRADGVVRAIPGRLGLRPRPQRPPGCGDRGRDGRGIRGMPGDRPGGTPFQGLAVVDAGQLEPAAPGDRQGGSAAAGRQSPLYRHFARARRGRSPLSLRAALLRPWRHGEPDQGVPARPICRSDVCEINAGQSIAAVVRLDGLRAHLRTAPARPRPYPVRPGHLRHDSPAAAEHRCLGPHQHPPHQGGDGLGLPPSARIRPRPRPPQQHWPITTRRSRPTYSRSVPLDGGGALLMPAPQLNTARPTFLPPQPQSKRPKNRTATYPREKCGPG